MSKEVYFALQMVVADRNEACHFFVTPPFLANENLNSFEDVLSEQRKIMKNVLESPYSFQIRARYLRMPLFWLSFWAKIYVKYYLRNTFLKTHEIKVKNRRITSELLSFLTQKFVQKYL